MKLFSKKRYVTLMIMGMRMSSLGIKFIFTVFVTKFLGTEALGVYGLLAALFLTAPGLLSLSMNHSIARDAPVAPKEQTRHDLAFYILYLTGVYLLLIPASAFYGMHQGNEAFFLMIAVILFLEHINNNGYQFCQNLNHSFLSNIMHFIRSALWMIVFMIVAYCNPAYATTEIMVLLWLAGSAIAAMMLIYTIRDYLRIHFSVLRGFIAKIRTKYQQNHYAFMHGQLFALSSYAGLAITELFLGTAQTGVYVFFMSIYSALQNLIRTGIHQVTCGDMIISYHQAQHEQFRMQLCDLSKKTRIYSLILALISLPAIYIIVHYVVKDAAISETMPIFPLILISFAIMNHAEVYKVAFYCARNDLVLVRHHAIMTGISMVFSVPLCMYGGLFGAFVALFISACLYYYAFKKQAKKHGFI